MANNARRVSRVHVAAVLVAETIHLPDSAILVMAGPAKLVAEGGIRRVIGRGVRAGQQRIVGRAMLIVTVAAAIIAQRLAVRGAAVGRFVEAGSGRRWESHRRWRQAIMTSQAETGVVAPPERG